MWRLRCHSWTWGAAHAAARVASRKSRMRFMVLYASIGHFEQKLREAWRRQNKLKAGSRGRYKTCARTLVCYLPSFMRPVTLVVVGDPKAPQMRLLKQLPAQVEVIVSDDADELRTAVPKADVLVNGGFHGTLFRRVFPYAAKAQWVHSLSSGVENMLSTELVASPIPITNGSGWFRH